MGILSGAGQIFGQAYANKQNRKAAEKSRAQQLQTIRDLDWQPMYASQTVPQYQKTQSPLARSYLDSMLMGNNPDSISSVAPGAAVQKRMAQTQQDRMFGTPQQRLAQQREAAENPYTFRTPERQVFGEQSQAAAFNAQMPNATAAGIDKETYQKLVDQGFRKGAEADDFTISGLSKEWGTAVKNALAAGDRTAVAELLNPHKLDRPHALTQNRQKRKRNEYIEELMNRYATAQGG